MKINNLAILTYFLLISANGASAGSNRTLSNNDDDYGPHLGEGYSSESEKLIPGGCFTPPSATAAGTATSGFVFQQSMSESLLSSELNVGLGARARYGVMT